MIWKIIQKLYKWKVGNFPDSSKLVVHDSPHHKECCIGQTRTLRAETGGQGSGKANRYVEVIRTPPGFTTNIRSQTDEASSWYSWWQSGSEYAKLGKDYIRPMGSGDSGRLPYRLGVNPSTGPEAFHPKILGNRMPQCGLGNSENAGQRCHNNLIGGTGSICRPSLPAAEKRWVITAGIQS